MRATVMYGAGDVRVEDVPDAKLQEPTDALVRVLYACICGSDLWPYGAMPASSEERRMGHEFLGVVEEVGSEVSGLSAGDVVVAPFLWADGTCDFCRAGLQTSCRHGGRWGAPGVDAGQGEAVRHGAEGAHPALSGGAGGDKAEVDPVTVHTFPARHTPPVVCTDPARCARPPWPAVGRRAGRVACR